MAPTPPKASSDDPLKLAELFQGGGEPWLPLLKPVIENLPNAATFVGPARDKRIVPVRELTFQALKPNPPEKWKVVIFGQTPYPRVESATGIAMFDNAFHAWSDPRFLQCASMRNILKAALIWGHDLAPDSISPKQIPPWCSTRSTRRGWCRKRRRRDNNWIKARGDAPMFLRFATKCHTRTIVCKR